MPVVVVTDSSASLVPEVVEEQAIQVVPLHVLSGDEDFREGIDVIPEDLAGVTTAGASPGRLSEAYAAAWEASEGAGVVAVHISRQLSGTWEAGRQAAQEFDGRVRIVDSQSAGMGLGYPVLEAARLAKSGADLETVYRRAVDVAGRSRCLIVVDRLDQLRRGEDRRGGRVARHRAGDETGAASRRWTTRPEGENPDLHQGDGEDDRFRRRAGRGGQNLGGCASHACTRPSRVGGAAAERTDSAGQRPRRH